MKQHAKLPSFLLVLFVSLSSAGAQSGYLTLEDLQKLVRISGPALSPHGKTAVFITSRADFESNTYESQLLQIDLATKQTKLLSTRKGIRQPTWSPDGRHLGFLAPGEKGAQIHILPISGGEAVPITTAPAAIRRFAWSPDGEYLAYVTDEAASEDQAQDPQNQSFAVGSNDYLTTGPPANRAIWIIDRSGKEARQLTGPGVTIGTGLTLTGLDWSADGESLAVTVYPTPFSGDSDLGRSALLDVRTGDLTWVTDRQTGESSPAFDPTSQRVAYVYPRDGVPANVSEVYVRDLQSGADESWTRALDRHIWDYRWLGDGSLVVFASDELRNGFWRVTGADSWEPVPLGEIYSVGDFDLSQDGALLFVGDGIHRPGELFFKPSLAAVPIELTSFNQFIGEREQGTRERFVWESTDGFQPNGVITYPPDFDPGRKHPLVLLIHGGPTASSGLSFDSTAQLMAAKGWVVFQPNYRGSENLGNAFQSAIANDASEGPGEDVISGVRALQKKPYIDPDAVAVSGWSYGGWMTAWLIGRYPEVWTAAVAGAAPVDFTDMYSLSDLNRMRRHAITDSPYVGDNLEKAYKQSPIIHFSRLRTPTLVLSVTGDYRVTITGSYKLFSALRDNGVPVEFIAYPGRGHFPSDPVQRQDVSIRWLGWLEKYLGG